MQNAGLTVAFGKRFGDGFTETISQEKNRRIASESLRDLMLFNNALETEIRKITSEMDKGRSIDQKMLDLMCGVKEKYNYAMSGMKALDEDMERYALCALADAIQDLMYYVHNHRKH
ncbi:MAG: hypothetical protein LW823_02745 [Rickettsiales bacterium]|jgi:hypothetical protein|nr:hypothetical protein [Rickettsiales bacterium]